MLERQGPFWLMVAGVCAVITVVLTFTLVRQGSHPSSTAPAIADTTHAQTTTPAPTTPSPSPAMTTSAASPNNTTTSIVGTWLSTTYGYTYYFVASGNNSYLGELAGQPSCSPANIMLKGRGGGFYSGTTPLYSGCSPTGTTVAITIQVSANGETAQFNSYGCSNCGLQNWIRESTKPQF